MKSLAIADRGGTALGRSHRGKTQGWSLIPGIGADQHAFPAMEPVRRIPDLRDVAAGPADAAIELVVDLPPAAGHLERHFDRRKIEPGPDCDRMGHRRA